MTTLAKKLAAIKPGTLLAGVDLSLDSLVVVVLDTAGQRMDRFKTEHSRAGYEYLARRLNQLVQPPAARAIWIGMEPTNYYWKLLATRLRRPATRPALSPGQSVDR
jgi:transposase